MKCSPDFAGIQLAFTVTFSSTIGTACGCGTGGDGRDELLEGNGGVVSTCWSMEGDKEQRGQSGQSETFLHTPPAERFRRSSGQNREYIYKT